MKGWERDINNTGYKIDARRLMESGRAGQHTLVLECASCWGCLVHTQHTQLYGVLLRDAGVHVRRKLASVVYADVFNLAELTEGAVSMACLLSFNSQCA